MIYVVIPTTKGRRVRLDECLKAVRASVCTEPITICLYENNDGGWVKALHNLLVGLYSDTIVFNIGDDVIIEPDCIQKLFDAFQKNKDDMSTLAMHDKPLLLQPYEQVHEGRICTNPFCTADVIRKYLFKGYVHNYADNELTDRVIKEGRYVYVPEARTKHVHFELDAKLYDETYDLTQRFFLTDRDLFRQRNAEGYLTSNE